MVKVDEIAKSFGFMVKRTCEFCAYYYLVDENGFDKYNEKGEKLCVEINLSVDPGGKYSLPMIWYKKGYTKEILKDWWCVRTYVTNKKGECYGAYDPTIQESEDGKRFVMNFDWHLRATPENFRKLLTEILRQYYA